MKQMTCSRALPYLAGTLASVLCTALFASVINGAAAAQAPGPEVLADKAKYHLGESAVVTVTGLLSCAGQQVELGLRQVKATPGTDEPVGDASPLVTVGADGSAEVSILLTKGLITFHTAPFVKGTCVPGGDLTGSPKAIPILLYPASPTPGSPQTGVVADSSSHPQASWIPFAVSVTVLSGFALAAFARRHY